MKKTLLIFMMAICSIGVQAQTQDSPWWLNLEFATNKFKFSYYDGLFDFGQMDNVGFRVGVERYLNASFDLEVGFSHGRLTHEDIFKGNVTDLDLRLAYKFDNGYILKEEAKVAPYIFAGYGLNWFSSIETIYSEYNDGTYQILPIGAGLKFKAVENAEINLRAAYKNSTTNSPNYMQYSIGIAFALKGKKDSDGDGMYDKEDGCPNQAGPEENNGCPWPDTDGDGVFDKDDACPTEAGMLNGCPDTDHDGVKDSEDACPSVAGLAEFNGCPDSDGDGVIDREDACPNVAGSLNGCPDQDGDGIVDSEDACPTLAGTLNGCPDSDGDGVKDSEDTCPQTAGLNTNNGCPVVKEEVKQVLDFAVKNVQFNSNSDVLKTSSYASLARVIKLMEENDFNLKLSGFTDNTGKEEYNLELSKRRANAVKQYLVSKGIAPSRLEADGFGIENPVANNATAAGRALNRRVELEIVFK